MIHSNEQKYQAAYGEVHPEVNMATVQEINGNEENGLSPIRQTSRKRQPIDYNHLSKGIGYGNDEDADDKGSAQGMNPSLNRSMSKDLKKGGYIKKNMVTENKVKMDLLFKNMKEHQFNHLLNQPLD